MSNKNASYAGLSTRARNTLLRAKMIYGIDDICFLSDKQIASLRWSGVKTVEELRQHRTRLLSGTPGGHPACDADSSEHARIRDYASDAERVFCDESEHLEPCAKRGRKPDPRKAHMLPQMLEMWRWNFTAQQIAETTSVNVHTVKLWLSGCGNIRRKCVGCGVGVRGTNKRCAGCKRCAEIEYRRKLRILRTDPALAERRKQVAEMRNQIAALCRERLDLTNGEIGAQFGKTAQYVGRLCQARKINRDRLRVELRVPAFRGSFGSVSGCGDSKEDREMARIGGGAEGSSAEVVYGI
jgi:hypothetical protein